MSDPIWKTPYGWVHTDEVWCGLYGPYPDRYVVGVAFAMYCFLHLCGGSTGGTNNGRTIH